MRTFAAFILLLMGSSVPAGCQFVVSAGPEWARCETVPNSSSFLIALSSFMVMLSCFFMALYLFTTRDRNNKGKV